MKSRCILLLLVLFLAACGGGKPEKPPYAGIKIGKPYEVYGRWYKPHYNASYDEIGVASWYGPGFHGGHTATGERYDQDGLTAAHKTLPLPSIVRVTNLDNGTSAILRVNDRGPFSHDRIIDLSRASALKLGVWRTGTAKVRVQFLDPETRAYVQNVLGSKHYYAAAEPLPPVALAPGAGEPVEPQAVYVPPQSLTAGNIIAAVPGGEPDEFSMVDAQADAQAVAEEPPALPPHTVASLQPFLAPVNKPKPVPATSNAPQPTSTGNHGFFVQAGTFALEENALDLNERMGLENSTQVTEIAIKGRAMYRVSIGPYPEREEAKKLLSKLVAAGISDAKIIRN